MLGHRAKMCHNLLEDEEINWTPGPGFLPVPLLPPGLCTCCSLCWEHSFPHTPFPGNAYTPFKWKLISSRTLSLTTQRRLNTTHLAWNTHHILSQLLVTCFPCYNMRFMRRSTLLYAFTHIFLANRQRIKDNHNTHCM